MTTGPIATAVEGLVDEAVVRRLLAESNIALGDVYGRGGKDPLLRQLSGYNQAAKRWPWFVVIDLDNDEACAPDFVARALPNPAPFMCFRVAVRAIEAWVLADRSTAAKFLGVPVSRLPLNPDDLDDPKGFLVDVARTSPRKDVVKDLVPTPRSGRRVGPLYTARLVELVELRWRPTQAAQSSSSLSRTLNALRRIRFP